MRIAIAGSRGQLGAAVVHECSGRHEVVALDHQALEITDDVAIADVLGQIHPDAIVNCTAFNDVDGAEDRPVDALYVNGFSVRTLARVASSMSAALVHFSTDFVFDGTSDRPYTELDRPNPRSVYAVSKLLGEWFATDAPRAYILRVESLFGRAPSAERPPKGSVAAMLHAMRAADEVRVFEDRTVSPTYVMDAARATRTLLERGIEPGLYHCVQSGHCTWLEFARELARQLGIDARLLPTRFADAKMRASRPLYCALSNDKLAAQGIAMPSWQDALARSLQAGAPGAQR